jgi:hypothetical protein
MSATRNGPAPARGLKNQLTLKKPVLKLKHAAMKQPAAQLVIPSSIP